MTDEGKGGGWGSRKITNPLTLIAVFAGLAETVATLVLTQLEKDIQLIFVWFVMLFPVFLVGGFYLILYKKPWALYAPSDYEDEENFSSLIKSDFSYQESEPDFLEDKIVRGQIIDWMEENSLEDESFTVFMYSDVYSSQRKKMMEELGLSSASQGE